VVSGILYKNIILLIQMLEMISDWNMFSYLSAVEELLFSATYFVLNVYQQKNVPSNNYCHERG
jgi:hypothetical protein